MTDLHAALHTVMSANPQTPCAVTDAQEQLRAVLRTSFTAAELVALQEAITAINHARLHQVFPPNLNIHTFDYLAECVIHPLVLSHEILHHIIADRQQWRIAGATHLRDHILELLNKSEHPMAKECASVVRASTPQDAIGYWAEESDYRDPLVKDTDHLRRYELDGSVSNEGITINNRGHQEAEDQGSPIPATIRVWGQHGISPLILGGLCHPVGTMTEALIHHGLEDTSNDGFVILGGSWLADQIRTVLTKILSGQKPSMITSIQALAWTLLLDEGAAAPQPFVVLFGNDDAKTVHELNAVTGELVATPPREV